MSSGVKKLPIGGLSPDVNNAFIIGVIIAKQDFRCFISKKDAEERGVWNFTLRDSLVDTINATVWGSADFTKYTFQIFNVGDVVEIVSPRILFKQPGSVDFLFNPVVSSPFQLHLQETSSDILLYSEDDAQNFRDLINIPTKPPGDYLRLSDVISYGQAMKGEYVNLLVAIKNVGKIRTVRSKKDSKDLICRNITVMDQSHLEFHMTLWNDDIIKRSDFWRSRSTVLFFADVRLEWDNFRSCITATITAKTIVTENPKTNEAISLENFAKTAPINPTAVLDHFANTVVDTNFVNTVMTTAQVLDKSYCGKSSEDRFTALVFAMITQLNLDGTEAVISYKCSRCTQTLDETRNCLNTECLTSRPDLNRVDTSFNLLVNLTDHRGTLQNCRLVSPTADEVLGCSVKDFIKMSVEEKTRLKWKLLLSRCEARILVLSTSPERPRPLISLLSCTPVKFEEIAFKLPFY